MSNALERRNKKVDEFLQRVNSSTDEVLQIRKASLIPSVISWVNMTAVTSYGFGQSTQSARRKRTLTTTKLAHLGTSPILI